MGTNYYWKNSEKSNNIQEHIGKRNAAGLYCWDCGTVLNLGGSNEIHNGNSPWNEQLDSCPSCGAEYNKDETLENSAVGAELGFGKITGEKQGLKSCCSFTWTLMKHLWKIQNLSDNVNREKVIINEYGEEFTADEFLQMLKGCPIQCQLPREFS